MRTLWVAAFTLLAGSAVLPAHELAASNPRRPTLLSRAEQPLHQYRAFRRMHADSENGKYEAWLEAWTELKDGRFSYEIVSERGLGHGARQSAAADAGARAGARQQRRRPQVAT